VFCSVFTSFGNKIKQGWVSEIFSELFEQSEVHNNLVMTLEMAKLQLKFVIYQYFGCLSTLKIICKSTPNSG
jgi:hypothetical protein